MEEMHHEAISPGATPPKKILVMMILMTMVVKLTTEGPQRAQPFYNYRKCMEMANIFSKCSQQSYSTTATTSAGGFLRNAMLSA
eukprot:478908-Amphidinium_carterae.1